METRGRLLAIASLLTCFLIQAQGADKYTDGNRPYEFGFSIDGEQHRHEKKDDKGLIEGEFGFITADGVYHVTVYATDEEGRFKILSMKNIRVKPYPTYTAKQASTSISRQGHSLDLPVSPQTSAPALATTTTFKPISIEPPAKSCSHCSLPTTSTPRPSLTPNQAINSNPNQIGNLQTTKFPQGVKPQSAFDGFSQQNNAQNYQTAQQMPQTSLNQGLQPPKQSLNFPQQGFENERNPPTHLSESQANLFTPEKGPDRQLQNFVPNNLQVTNNPGSSLRPPVFSQQQPQVPEKSPGKSLSTFSAIDRQAFPDTKNIPQIANGVKYPEQNSDIPRENVLNERTPKSFNNEPRFGSVNTQQNNNLQNNLPNNQDVSLPVKPKLISAEMQIVDKNTDIHRLEPGEREGLPEGLTEDHMNRLLYTFNYTVGFHGHFEEGYTNGVKQGYYFITGRNGVRTRVDYVADSKGFRPKISQEVLDLLSDDVPKPETEKEEKYGLKGYEFKWLYYPVEAKGR